MLQITYVSTARDPNDAALMQGIESQAHRLNKAFGLSGLLLFDGLRFLQVLEGPADEVERTYSRIAADKRHFALVMLRERVIQTPSFGRWSMLCRDVTNEKSSLVDLITPLIADADKSTRALFASFAQIRAKAA